MITMPEADWRLFNQKNYLQGKLLMKACFVGTNQCDHVHCAFCWEKIGQDEKWLRFGYCTNDHRHWICEQCFQDFKDQFEWIVEN